MFLVKRLWSYYLFIGVLFFILWLLYSVESLAIKLKPTIWRQSKILSSISAVAGTYCLVFILFHSLSIWVPYSIDRYKKGAHRTASPIYKSKQMEYSRVRNILSELSMQTSDELRVFYNPTMFLPQSKDSLRIQPFYTAFTLWDKGWGVAVLKEGDIPVQNSDGQWVSRISDPNSTKYEQNQRITREFLKHVQYPGRDTKNTCISPCYTLFEKFNDALIYLRSDLMPKNPGAFD